MKVDIPVNNRKSEEYIKAECRRRGLQSFRGSDLLSKTIYRGYVELPKNSGNKFYICEPLLTEEQINEFEKTKHQNIVRYAWKHDYEFHNKVYINGKLAKHTLKENRQGHIYRYYYIPGTKYINENDIMDYINKCEKQELVKHQKKLEERIKKATQYLMEDRITKEEFDAMYEEYKRKETKQVSISKIYVTVNPETKEVMYNLEIE